MCNTYNQWKTKTKSGNKNVYQPCPLLKNWECHCVQLCLIVNEIYL